MWFFGDGDSSIKKNVYHYFPDISLYRVGLVVNNSCFTDSIYRDIIVLPFLTDTGRLNMPVNSSVIKSFIFPNPSIDYLYVVLNDKNLNNEDELFVEIYDNTGKIEAKEKFENTKLMKLYTGDLKNGVHFLKITNIKTILDKHKFIKQ